MGSELPPSLSPLPLRGSCSLSLSPAGWDLGLAMGLVGPWVVFSQCWSLSMCVN